jgi:hypothetical protein
MLGSFEDFNIRGEMCKLADRIVANRQARLIPLTAKTVTGRASA